MERGGVAAIVAVLVGGGVLLGMAALAVNVGNIMFERRQLQNGADAAAHELADLCAQDVTACDVANTTTMNRIGSLNSANAADGTSALNTARAGVDSGVCGRVPTGANIPACPADALDRPASDWTECPALPSAWASGTAPYVQVYTQTATSTSTGVLDSVLGFADSSPVACARVGWGSITSASTLPLTFANCEVPAPDPPDAEPHDVGYGIETSLPLKYGRDEGCSEDTAPSGGDFGGGFGWLNDPDSDCVVDSAVPGWVDADTGVGAGTPCIPDLNIGDVYLIPVFTCFSDSDAGDDDPCVPGSPSGTNVYYYISRYVAFELTNFKLTSTGGWEVSVAPPSPGMRECTEESLDNKCLVGKFVEDYVDPTGEVDPTSPGGGDGPYALQPIG
jgi:hypothetical protein